MRAALERDSRDQGRSVRLARQETESAIQPLMGFLRDNLERQVAPHEQVIVFDEAQRAWISVRRAQIPTSAERGCDVPRHHATPRSLVSHHRACRKWSGNQHWRSGSVGLGEALLQRPEWHIHAAPVAINATEARQRMFVALHPNDFNPDLHLDVPIRSIKSAAAAPWVDAVLKGDVHLAREIADKAHGVPFLLTRSLQAMRGYLRDVARGLRRAGLVCSAGARRLRADGIYPNFPHMEADTVANWFLARWPDVRASDALEMPATQFACQGLELDYVGLCWGNDLSSVLVKGGGLPGISLGLAGNSSWRSRASLPNQYLSGPHDRARYATVIWAPEGDVMDITRDPEFFLIRSPNFSPDAALGRWRKARIRSRPTIQTSLI